MQFEGILEAVKKYSTLKFIMNISFVPSVCIHRSIVLISIEKVCLSIFFPHGIYFFVIFDFNFREKPRFRDEFQALIWFRSLATIADYSNTAQ